VLVLVVAVLMVSYASSLRAYLEQRDHIASLQASIAESKATIAQLERERQRWKDPAYVRAEARERFGWVLPGEIGFQVIGEDGKPLDHHDTLTDPATVTEAAAPPVWWQTAWASVEAAGNPEAHQAPPPAATIRPPKRANR
jgi:cell division protein FtsB